MVWKDYRDIERENERKSREKETDEMIQRIELLDSKLKLFKEKKEKQQPKVVGVLTNITFWTIILMVGLVGINFLLGNIWLLIKLCKLIGGFFV